MQIEEKMHVPVAIPFPDDFVILNENIHNMYCVYEQDVSQIHLFL